MDLTYSLPWLLSAATLFQNWLTGNKWKYVWLLAIFNYFLWTYWTIVAKQWGMMPMNLVSLVISARNHFKWNK